MRPAVITVTLLSAVALFLGVGYSRNRSVFTKGQDSLVAEIAAVQQEHADRLQEETQQEEERVRIDVAFHQARLHDTELLSGNAARLRHAREWQQRLTHDPALAGSILETNLLKMERLGGDPAIAAQEALREVARLAAPRGSRIEVKPMGSGFAVRVAFKMSALTEHETGGVTKHQNTTSMRREIESLSADLVQHLFDYCGSRGIEKLSVSCNKAVSASPIPKNATQAETEALVRSGELVMRSLYRVSVDAASGRSVANWRALSLPRVIQLLKVEHDGLRTLTIGDEVDLQTKDPNMELEF